MEVQDVWMHELPTPETPKTPKREVSKSKSAKNESFKNPKIAEPDESSENLFESKCILFLFLLAYKCCVFFMKFKWPNKLRIELHSACAGFNEGQDSS
jgi:hypothetical protein